jgi:tetratricopeptide (TPR) repeat protein
MDGRETRWRRFPLLLGAMLAALAALHVVASFMPTNHLWGLDALGVFPPAARLAWAAAAAALLAAAARFGAPRVPLPGGRARTLAVVAATTLAMTALFILLREAAPLWGDGYLRLDRIAEGKPANPFAGRSELESWLQSAAHGALRGATGGRPAPVAVAWSIAMGALFVPAAFAAARSAVSREMLAPCVALLLAGVTTHLFFGHIESYATFAAALTAVLALGLAALKGSVPRIAPAAALAPLVLIHPAGIALAPAVLLLAGAPGPRSRPGRGTEKLLAVIVLVFLLVRVVHHAREMIAGQIRGQALQMGPAGIARDTLNEWALVHPAALVLVAALAASLGWKRVARDRTALFLLLATAPLMALPLVVSAELGGLRDWDLFASFGIPLPLLAARLLDTAPIPAAVRSRAAAMTLALAVIHAAPWIAMNASDTRIVARYEKLLSATPSLPSRAEGLAHGALGDYKASRGRPGEALDAYEKAWHLSRRPAYLQKLIALHREAGNAAKAEELSRELVAAAGERPEAHLDRGTILARERRYGEAIEEFRRALELDPRSAAAKVNLGAALAQSGRLDEGRALIESAAREHPEFAAAHTALGYLLLHEGRAAEAATSFRRALALQPSDPSAREGLARAEGPPAGR